VYTRALNWANITPRCLTKGYGNTKDTLRIYLLEFRPCMFCVKYGCQFRGASIYWDSGIHECCWIFKNSWYLFFYIFFLPSFLVEGRFFFLRITYLSRTRDVPSGRWYRESLMRLRVQWMTRTTAVVPP